MILVSGVLREGNLKTGNSFGSGLTRYTSFISQLLAASVSIAACYTNRDTVCQEKPRTPQKDIILQKPSKPSLRLDQGIVTILSLVLKAPSKSCLDAQIYPGSKKCPSFEYQTQGTEADQANLYIRRKDQQHDLFEDHNQEHQDADKNQNYRQLRVFPGFAHKFPQPLPCPVQGRLVPIHVLFDII